MHDINLNFEGFQVTFRSAVIEKVLQFQQNGLYQPEACGILLGYQWDSAVEIIDATSPQSSDRRFRNGYVREITGHVETAMVLWLESKGLVGYLGEWHTHPEHTAIPSPKDVREGMRIARKNGVPVVSLIIGQQNGCCSLLSAISASQFQTIPLLSPSSESVIPPH